MFQGFGGSPTKAIRVLGLERREIGLLVSGFNRGIFIPVLYVLAMLAVSYPA